MSGKKQRVGWTRKKKTRASGERREEERVRWREQMKERDARRLVFFDEGGSNVALTLRCAHGSVPRNRGKNMSLLASLSLSGIWASMMIEGTADAAAFEA
jgi:hypothetical protein